MNSHVLTMFWLTKVYKKFVIVFKRQIRKTMILKVDVHCITLLSGQGPESDI